MPGDILDNQGRGSASWHWPSVHPEGRKFAGISGGAMAVALIFGWHLLALPLAVLTVFILAFFRNPRRVTPQGAGLIISPADGLIALIGKVEPPAELTMDDSTGAPRLAPGLVTRISIFMSVFDVHINRAPIGGTVRRVVYIPGKFLSADLDKASEENERQHILIDSGIASGGGGAAKGGGWSSASPRSPGWWRGGSCPLSSRGTSSPLGSASA